MPHLLFIFVDGIGLAPLTAHNPFTHAAIPALRGALGGAPSTELLPVVRPGAAMVALDACLGVIGLPQSGTGQATLMTGENCPKLHGGHFGPYPPSRVRPMLLERNLFATCAALKLPFDFANAYPDKYFDYLNAHPALKPSIASSFESTGRSLHGVADMAAGNAVPGDVLGDRWHEIGHAGVTAMTAHDAGKRLAIITQRNAFTMFEFWLTDKAGHKQDMPAALAALERLDGLIGGVLDSVNLRDTLVVITSDHGNMENLLVPTHTLNSVPLIAIGRDAAGFVRGATTLMDVAPAIIERLKSNPA